MVQDYIARKAAKKRKKKARQDVGLDGRPKRERKKSRTTRRLCQGMCYKMPVVTEEDREWVDEDGAGPGPQPDSDIEEEVRRADTNALASTSGEPLAAATTRKAAATAAAKNKHKQEQKKQSNEGSSGLADGNAGDGAPADGPRMSTAVGLLPAEMLAHNAKVQALKKLPPGAKAEALDPFPALLRACMLGQGFVEPTPIQAQCWPATLQGRDVLGVAEPGSGKTMAYLLPGLEALQAAGHSASTRPEGPLLLVLLPTRELALQVAAQARHTRQASGLRTVCVYGGAPREEQVALLRERAPHIVVGTPGRVLDLVDGGELKLQGHVRYVVLDEADKMLSIGFRPHLMRLRALLLLPPEAAPAEAAVAGPAKKKRKKLQGQAEAAAEQPQQQGAGGVAGVQRPQVLLFSATMPEEVQQAADEWLHQPHVVRVSHSAASISRTVTQVVHVCAEHKKPDKLLKHLGKVKDSSEGQRNPPRVLVFANRIKTVRFLAERLASEGYRTVMLHGERSQPEREAAVRDFRGGKAQVLVATDVAARGLDIRGLPYVVNYDFPPRLETYIHRVGRTGRLAAYGHAYSFFTRNLAKLAGPLAELLQAHGQAVDPNLLTLAQAWRIAEEKLGAEAAAAAAERAERAGEAGHIADDDGDDGPDADELEEARLAAEAAGHGAGGRSREAGAGLADEVLGAAEDLMEGLAPGVAAALGQMLKATQHKKDKAKKSKGSDRPQAAEAAAEPEERQAKKLRQQQRDGHLVPSCPEGAQASSAKQQQQLQPQLAFLVSKRFTGARPGYAFKLGALGLGYYLDPRSAGAARAAAAPQQQAPSAKKAAAAVAAGAPVRSKGAAKLVALRNQPIIAPPRARDLLELESGSGDDSDDGGAGGKAPARKRGRDNAGDTASDDEPPPAAAAKRAANACGAARAAPAKLAMAVAANGVPAAAAGWSREDSSGDDGSDGGGERAAAKKKHKALPGRLRKKLAKQRANQGEA